MHPILQSNFSKPTLETLIRHIFLRAKMNSDLKVYEELQNGKYSYLFTTT